MEDAACSGLIHIYPHRLPRVMQRCIVLSLPQDMQEIYPEAPAQQSNSPRWSKLFSDMGNSEHLLPLTLSYKDLWSVCLLSQATVCIGSQKHSQT